MRTRLRRRGVLDLLAAGLAIAAQCGFLGGSGVVQPGTGSDLTPAPITDRSTGPSDADLTIVVDNGAGTKTSWTLTCNPAGGSHPDAVAACAALAANGDTALPPVPQDRICTQIFGGPETAMVIGVSKGEQVSSTFSRTNGCELGRWSALTGLLPVAGAPAT